MARAAIARTALLVYRCDDALPLFCRRAAATLDVKEAQKFTVALNYQENHDPEVFVVRPIQRNIVATMK